MISNDCKWSIQYPRDAREAGPSHTRRCPAHIRCLWHVHIEALRWISSFTGRAPQYLALHAVRPAAVETKQSGAAPVCIILVPGEVLIQSSSQEAKGKALRPRGLDWKQRSIRMGESFLASDRQLGKPCSECLNEWFHEYRSSSSNANPTTF